MSRPPPSKQAYATVFYNRRFASGSHAPLRRGLTANQNGGLGLGLGGSSLGALLKEALTLLFFFYTRKGKRKISHFICLRSV